MKKDLTTGSIRRHLLRLTLPNIGGFVAITAFNLTDTYFVSRLGTLELAAMGFTFPVVMVIGALSAGISMGTGSVLARALGAGDRDRVRHTATYGLLLALFVTAVVSLAGTLTMDPLFRAMGADEAALPLVKAYMLIWYLGSAVAVTPPVGDANLRATGDMIRPFVVMTICAGVNVVLDPLLIFGIGPFPAMGIRGAALATVVARGCGMVATLSFNRSADLLDLGRPRVAEIRETWRRILHVGLPAVATQLLPSILRGVLTALAAGVAGAAGVAALAAGTRVESVPMMVGWAYNSALLTVIGQNWGAGKLERVRRAQREFIAMAFVYGLPLFALTLILAPAAAGLFTNDPEVLRLTIRYLRIVMGGICGVLLYSWTAIALNAAGKPLWSLLINACGIAGLMIPGAVIGRLAAGFSGMLYGLVAGYLATGALAFAIGRRRLAE